MYAMDFPLIQFIYVYKYRYIITSLLCDDFHCVRTLIDHFESIRLLKLGKISVFVN